MTEKAFKTDKTIFTIIFSIGLISSFLGIIYCLLIDTVSPLTHGTACLNWFISDAILLFIVRKTTLSDDAKKE